jgi:hypothetical protein
MLPQDDNSTMSNSTASSSRRTAAESATSGDTLHDSSLHTPLLLHKIVCEDVLVVTKLQQTSKQLQAAVGQLLQGQLSVDLSTAKLQQLQGFQTWLGKHAGLLKRLFLQIDARSSADRFSNLPFGFKPGSDSCWLGTAAQGTLRSLLLTAAACHNEPQSLTLRGTTASVELLQQLPACHVTELHAEVDLNCSSSMQAVAALSRLEHLQLFSPARTGSDDEYTPADAADGALAPLATGLQQLTQLHIDPVTPAQLLQLPPKLQQLHIALRNYSWQDVQQLAVWLPSHVSILSSLHLEGRGDWPDVDDQPAAALSTLTAAFAAAAAAGAAASAAAAAEWRLASLSVLGLTGTGSAAPLLQTLPVSSLTHLACDVGWENSTDMAALCSLTALKGLQLQERHSCAPIEDEGDEDAEEDILRFRLPQLEAVPPPVLAGGLQTALVPLSALQQLTRLELSVASSKQLQHLQLPWLQHLVIQNLAYDGPAEPQLLGNLTSLVVLDVRECFGLCAADQLPPNLRTLKLHFSTPMLHTFPRYLDHASLLPLLDLSRLEQLHLDLLGVDCTAAAAAAAHEVAQLSTLHALQRVHIVWRSKRQCPVYGTAAAFAAAFQLLPLKGLTWHHQGLPAAVLQQLGDLQGLTALSLHAEHAYARGQEDGVTVAQLAALLQRLTALQCLHLYGDTAAAGSGQPEEVCDDSNGIRELLQAICSLQQLSAVGVRLYVKLPDAAVTQLNDSLQQLLRGAVAQGCVVSITPAQKYNYPRTPVLRIHDACHVE